MVSILVPLWSHLKTTRASSQLDLSHNQPSKQMVGRHDGGSLCWHSGDWTGFKSCGYAWRRTAGSCARTCAPSSLGCSPSPPPLLSRADDGRKRRRAICTGTRIGEDSSHNNMWEWSSWMRDTKIFREEEEGRKRELLQWGKSDSSLNISFRVGLGLRLELL